MKRLLILLAFLFQIAFTYGQDNSFSFITKYKDEATLFKLADSLKLPLLILSDNKIYVIGGDCITRDLGGNATGRDEDGDDNDRDKDGNTNSREKGGSVGYRDNKGKGNQRDKTGKGSRRDKDGNIVDREKDGNVNQRDKEGKSDIGTRCGVTKSGKLLLYTRENINAKQTQIYYNGKYFSNKYYKIMQL